jgi:hypothetical protein
MDAKKTKNPLIDVYFNKDLPGVWGKNYRTKGQKILL